MPIPIDGLGLTFKQRIFCDSYLKDYNATRAACEAGYSKDSAYQIAAENLRKPLIKKYLEVRMNEAIEKAQVGLDWRLDILKQTAQACIEGRADKDACVDAKGVVSVISEINKMSGDYAATNSNVKIETTDLNEACGIAKECEKEITEIKEY